MPYGQGGTFTGLLNNVTAPVRASALPFSVAPVSSETDACAIMVPAKIVVVPSVAELPTCQNTLHADPPLITATDEALAVVSVLPILKMNTAPGLPWASSRRSTVSTCLPPKQNRLGWGTRAWVGYPRYGAK